MASVSQPSMAKNSIDEADLSASARKRLFTETEMQNRQRMEQNCLQYQKSYVLREERALTVDRIYQPEFRGCTVWFTGLSSSGKTSISFELEKLLVSHGIAAFTLDGDNIRSGLNADLGFSDAESRENIRRVTEVAKLFAESGIICLCSFVSPSAEGREMARRVHEEAESCLRFFEVFVDTPIEVCERRDVKGVYKRARDGSLPFDSVFNGYELPAKPDVRVDTVKFSPMECALQVLLKLKEENIIPLDLRRVKVNGERVNYSGLLLNAKLASVGISPSFDSSTIAALPADAEQCCRNQLKLLELSKADFQWLQTISQGWAYPLKGFMRETEYLQSLHCGCLNSSDGQLVSLPLPVVLPVSDVNKTRLANEKEIQLTYENRVVAVLKQPEFYRHDREERCARLYGAGERNRRLPAVQAILNGDDWLIGGDLQVIDQSSSDRVTDNNRFYQLSPGMLLSRFKELNTDGVAAVHLSSAPQNGCASFLASVLKHLAACGVSKPVLLVTLPAFDDEALPLATRVEHYRSLLHEVAEDASRVVFAVLPASASNSSIRDQQWLARCASLVGARFYVVNDGETASIKASHLVDILKATPGLNRLEFLTYASLGNK